MLINGEWEPNVTCQKCRYRHPAGLTCKESREYAKKTDIGECELCGDPTRMTGNRMCNRCWELETRIRMDPELSQKILDDLESQ